MLVASKVKMSEVKKKSEQEHSNKIFLGTHTTFSP